jgi:hypothetical protein
MAQLSLRQVPWSRVTGPLRSEPWELDKPGCTSTKTSPPVVRVKRRAWRPAQQMGESSVYVLVPQTDGGLVIAPSAGQLKR